MQHVGDIAALQPDAEQQKQLQYIMIAKRPFAVDIKRSPTVECRLMRFASVCFGTGPPTERSIMSVVVSVCQSVRASVLLLAFVVVAWRNTLVSLF